ncbi:unnamed protein product [Pedinophyceae sp. YPF-701]|nr:unnamed protein product [Pedinophyceae sp. YPF-701]
MASCAMSAACPVLFPAKAQRRCSTSPGGLGRNAPDVHPRGHCILASRRPMSSLRSRTARSNQIRRLVWVRASSGPGGDEDADNPVVDAFKNLTTLTPKRAAILALVALAALLVLPRALLLLLVGVERTLVVSLVAAEELLVQASFALVRVAAVLGVALGAVFLAWQYLSDSTTDAKKK